MPVYDVYNSQQGAAPIAFLRASVEHSGTPGLYTRLDIFGFVLWYCLGLSTTN